MSALQFYWASIAKHHGKNTERPLRMEPYEMKQGSTGSIISNVGIHSFFFGCFQFPPNDSEYLRHKVVWIWWQNAQGYLNARYSDLHWDHPTSNWWSAIGPATLDSRSWITHPRNIETWRFFGFKFRNKLQIPAIISIEFLLWCSLKMLVVPPGCLWRTLCLRLTAWRRWPSVGWFFSTQRVSTATLSQDPPFDTGMDGNWLCVRLNLVLTYSYYFSYLTTRGTSFRDYGLQDGGQSRTECRTVLQDGGQSRRECRTVLQDGMQVCRTAMKYRGVNVKINLKTIVSTFSSCKVVKKVG